jgi:hypothetical protein
MFETLKKASNAVGMVFNVKSFAISVLLVVLPQLLNIRTSLSNIYNAEQNSTSITSITRGIGDIDITILSISSVISLSGISFIIVGIVNCITRKVCRYCTDLSRKRNGYESLEFSNNKLITCTETPNGATNDLPKQTTPTHANGNSGTPNNLSPLAQDTIQVKSI